MSISFIFTNGQGIIVSAHGPGSLHLLSYASNGKLVDIISIMSVAPSTPDKITRFIITPSQSFISIGMVLEKLYVVMVKI